MRRIAGPRPTSRAPGRRRSVAGRPSAHRCAALALALSACVAPGDPRPVQLEADGTALLPREHRLVETLSHAADLWSRQWLWGLDAFDDQLARATGDAGPALRPYLSSLDEADWPAAGDAPVLAWFGRTEAPGDEGWQAWVAVRHDAFEAELAAMRARFADVQDGLPIPEGHRPEDVRPTARVLLVDDVHRAGAGADGQEQSHVLPSDPDRRAREGRILVYAVNVAVERSRRRFTPAADALFDLSAPPSGELRQLVAHFLAHDFGPRASSTKAARERTEAALGERLATTLEETKAELAAALLCAAVAPDAAAADDAHLACLVGAFLVLAEHRAGEAPERHGLASALVIDTARRGGALEPGPQGATPWQVRPAALEEAYRSLLAEVLEIQAFGDRARGEALLRRADRLDFALHHALDRVDALHEEPVIPRFVLTRGDG